jgi:hypothetical protein
MGRMVLVAVGALLLWRALRWLRLHWRLLQATAPTTREPSAPTSSVPTSKGALFLGNRLPQSQRGEAAQGRLLFGESAEAGIDQPAAMADALPVRQAALFEWREDSAGVPAPENHALFEEPERLHIEEENNADPIDGMLLLPGEATVRCVCGLVYRLESLAWLEEQLGGACVQCKERIRSMHMR